MVSGELKVLIIDCDLDHLIYLEKVLKYNYFKVTRCDTAKEAISMLQEDVNRFDVVIADINMVDMDGFALLNYIAFVMDLPVLMTLKTADVALTIEDVALIKKGMRHGACDFLIKPVQLENVKFLWKYKYLKQTRVEQGWISPYSSKIDSIVPISEGEDEKSRKKREYASNMGDVLVNDDAISEIKQRVVWSRKLHAKFLEAIDRIGTEKVTPKKILEIMNDPRLTRDNVASHLQKYRHRQHRRRYQRILQHQNEGRNFISPAVDNVHNIREQVVSTSSSCLDRDVTSLNSQNSRSISSGSC